MASTATHKCPDSNTGCLHWYNMRPICRYSTLEDWDPSFPPCNNAIVSFNYGRKERCSSDDLEGKSIPTTTQRHDCEVIGPRCCVPFAWEASNTSIILSATGYAHGRPEQGPETFGMFLVLELIDRVTAAAGHGEQTTTTTSICNSCFKLTITREIQDDGQKVRKLLLFRYHGPTLGG